MTSFEKNIGKLDFHFKQRNDEDGVLLTANFLVHSPALSAQEIFALELAQKKFLADAVYFRYFNDGRGAVPQIYIYDNTDLHLTEVAKKDIHIRVWSGCQVPLFIIIENTEVKVFDAREKVKPDIENLALETIQLTGQAIRKFSAKSFNDGTFWEAAENENHFQFTSSAYKDLITGLKNVYGDFQKTSKLNSHVALKLLVQCLLIKYLEERDEQSKSGYLAKTYFKRNFACNNFCEVIRAGKLLDLLDLLATDFNGKIFEWHKKDERAERKDISSSDTTRLADYLDANIKNHQFVLWRLYSFSNLPVELISSVYEELLTNSKDIVYTPEMIVSTLVDESMPLNSPKEQFKVIDVSCGSGIFLVKAYKRIIQWWRYKKWQETGNLIKPSLADLKSLLTKNIFGVDIEPDAIRLTVFSLALALLDEVDLDPPTWQKLRFPDLSEKNIKTQEFFEFITDNPSNDYDLVIGNPPFNPPKDSEGETPSNGDYFESLKETYGYSSDIKIPDDNPALHFLIQAIKLLKPSGLLCLIQPSGPLLYQHDKSFKKDIFSRYNLLQVIDFTKLSNVLWGRKNIATAAVFIQNGKPDDSEVVHIIANRTFSNINRLFLELDHYDFHLVKKEALIDHPSIWKANLLGGGRLVQLIDRMSSLRTIEQFLKSKESAGWKWSHGFIENAKDPKPAPFITGKDFLPTTAFTESGIDYSKVFPCKLKLFGRRRYEELYTPPHLLIRKILGKENLITAFVERYLTFVSDIYSIHAPENQEKELKSLSDFLGANGKLLRFHILATSSRVKVNKATSLYDEDILHLPYPENFSDASLSKTESLLVEDALEYVFPADAEKKLVQFATLPQVKSFSTIFTQTLNSIYDADGKSFRLLKVLDAGKYYALHFDYSKGKGAEKVDQTADLEQYIQEIIPTEKQQGKRTHTQRVLKVFGKDTIILAKPKQMRYWLHSVALRDADETFADYIKARYTNAKG
jgi:type I restriction-modification system DNA methylase subunit